MLRVLGTRGEMAINALSALTLLRFGRAGEETCGMRLLWFCRVGEGKFGKRYEGILWQNVQPVLYQEIQARDSISCKN